MLDLKARTSRVNPFPGLRPFGRGDKRFFVGRDLELQTLLPRLHMLPLTVMFARSGIGKSSFLACRLIPAIRETCPVECVDEWDMAAPHEIVANARSALSNDHNRPPKGPEKPLLVLDQFEDVFKCKFDRHRLWDLLAEMVNVNDPPVHMLISIREEWLGAWVEAEEYMPSALASLVRLGPLADTEAAGAITRPPEIEGYVKVAPEVTGAIIRDLTRPSVYGVAGEYVELALLQLVCRRLWDIAADETGSGQQVIDLQLYNGTGRADNIAWDFALSGLGRVGQGERVFSAEDRVLWFGMVRHLVAAQGVKAIVTPETLAGNLRIEDLGFAGPATAQACLSVADQGYLGHPPERRGHPSEALVARIQGVLEKGVKCGFLKRHRGRAGTTGDAVFELVHDYFGDVFRELSVDFESWLRGRVSRALWPAVVTLCVAPVLAWYIAVRDSSEDVERLLTWVVVGVGFIGLVALVVSAWKAAWQGLKFRIVRRCAKGLFRSRTESHVGSTLFGPSTRLG